MSEPIDGHTARAEDGQHQSLRQTETDRAALLREVGRLEAQLDQVRADCEEQTSAALPSAADDLGRRIERLGVWAQARRTLNILNAEEGNDDE